MAPRSADNLVIAVSGTHPGYRQAQLKSLIERLGATFSSSMSAEWTHLVTTHDINKQSTKYKAACDKNGCQIVSLDWLVKLSQSGKPVSEQAYLLRPHADENGQDKLTVTTTSTATNTHYGRQAGTKNEGAVTVDHKNEDTESRKGDVGTTKDGKKRDAEQVAGAEDTPKKRTKDTQKASSKFLNVPVDDGLRDEAFYFPDPQVYIDDSGLIWDATLNQTKASANNNKFYVIQLLRSSRGEYITWTRWGRVGEGGQSAVLGGGSLKTCTSWFEKKFRDKTGHKWENRLDTPKPGKYTFIERDYDDDDDDEADEDMKKEPKGQKSEAESALSKPLQNLMSFIFNPEHFATVLASMHYDASKLPLGKLSPRTLKTGFSILKELSEIIADPNLAQPRHGLAYTQAIEDFSNRYFTTIPHVFGRNRPPAINTSAQIKKEVELLEALTNMDVANEIINDAREADEINQLDRQFQSLGMEEMTRLDPKSREFTELANYLSNSRGATHHLNYKVIDIFRIERRGENNRFLSSPYGKLGMSDRRLLWHGSRSTNFGGILSQGLRIAPPEAPVNGYMFGKGVYLADTSSKSANYCCSYSSANMGLLLLCDVELGHPMLELYDGDDMAGENAKKEGKIATLGQGRSIPGGWKDAECLHPSLKGVKMPDVSLGSGKGKNPAKLQYNEYIVYDVAQIRQRYLFYVHMR